jgi:hypothetical protein
MSLLTTLPFALVMQTAARVRYWQGRRLFGFLLLILVVLGIVYLVKRIITK